MILSSIQLKNLRNHKNISLAFSDGLNYIVGENGAGKTTILEAIYYLCTTKSIFAKTDSEVVSFNEEEFEIVGELRDKSNSTVRVYFSQAENKKYYFDNNKNVTRLSEVIGKYPVVLLTPADHSITQGSPADRRKFVDSIISQVSSTYLKILIDYNRCLRQRASLLNQVKEGRRKDVDIEIKAWTEKLITSGVEIIKHKIIFLKDFIDHFKESYKKILKEKEIPNIEYRYLNNSRRADVHQEFVEQLNSLKGEELRRGTNLVGPHRDEFVFRINDVNLKQFGSQGQHKTFQTALRFAEFFYIKSATGKSPLLLLDDVFGELDAERVSKISSYLPEVGQTFITMTDLPNFSFLRKSSEDRIIYIEEKNIRYA